MVYIAPTVTSICNVIVVLVNASMSILTILVLSGTSPKSKVVFSLIPNESTGSIVHPKINTRDAISFILRTGVCIIVVSYKSYCVGI